MKREIIFEVVPPSKRASKKHFDKVVDALTDSIIKMRSIAKLNIPEILDENYLGLPYCRNFDNREFGALLKERCKKDIILNKGVVYFNPKEKFEQWLNETITKYGINEFVFVGGTHQHNYPGPSVIEANKIAAGMGLRFGNIVIPKREDEANYLIDKTKSGCRFFTSQILFDSVNAIRIINDYSEKCRQNDIRPSEFYLSFTPLSDVNDIEFLAWLGVHIDEATERKLTNSADMGTESVRLIQEIYSEIIAKTECSGVHIGLNIEQVTFHNLALSVELVDIFSNS